MPLENYTSEFALNMQSEKMAICRLSNLDLLAKQDYFNEDSPCHIYMITRRPRVYIDKNGLTFTEEKVFLTFRAQIEDSFEEITVELINNRKSDDLRLETIYPYSVFKVFDKGIEIVHSDASVYLTKLLENGYQLGEFANNFDLDVLYVGQAYGKAGSRKASDRLKSHSTMQSIYEEANRNNPDKEILLCLFTFKQWLLTSFDGTKKLSPEQIKLDDEHMKNVMNRVMFEGITEQQEINFTEAALIKYFQPPYNIEYKNTFPNPVHSTYSECYDIDVNSICLELNTEDIFCRLYSKHQVKRWIHFASFNLHTREDRITMFRFIY